MAIALGLDAGGTYTDAVLYDLDTNTLLASAKAPTTPPDYVRGVAEAVNALPSEIRAKAEFVALSTTLATNAIVEHRHAPAGLVLIGYDEYEARSVNWSLKRRISGRHSIRGEETEPFDENGLRTAVADLLNEGVAGLAISGVMSTRNPDHELRALDIAASMCDLPLVVGHRVAGVLNAIVRAETAALNAGLIPIIHRFIDAVESVLSSHGVGNAPLFMVTGDGSLMSSTAARLRPVETILSGPACSALGAARLSGVRDAVVADIGGTTTDIAVLECSRPRMSAGGVSVGSWRAGVRSAQVLTRGLGGDSEINVRPRLSVGPRRVVSISRLASMSDVLANDIIDLADCVRAGKPPGGDWSLTNPTDAFVRLPGDPPAKLTDEERKILNALADGPLTRRALGAAIDYPYLSIISTGRLEAWGLVQRGGLTPTDLWHVTAEYAPYHVGAARAASELCAVRLDVTVDELIERVREQMTQSLVRQVTQAHLGVEEDGCAGNTFTGKLTRIALREVPSNGLAAQVTLKPPVIGVGAPANLFLKHVTERINGRLVVPDGAAVANAVGAAVGAVTAVAEALIRPQESGDVLCYAPDERRMFASRDEAVEWARTVLLPSAKAELVRRGAHAAAIHVTIEHRGAEVIDSPDPIWWETVVAVRGVGRPNVGVDSEDAKIDVSEIWTPGLREAEARPVDTVADNMVY